MKRCFGAEGTCLASSNLPASLRMGIKRRRGLVHTEVGHNIHLKESGPLKIIKFELWRVAGLRSVWVTEWVQNQFRRFMRHRTSAASPLSRWGEKEREARNWLLKADVSSRFTFLGLQRSTGPGVLSISFTRATEPGTLWRWLLATFVVGLCSRGGTWWCLGYRLRKACKGNKASE